MSFTNNVTRFLDGKKVDYTVHTYTYSPETHSAVEVAEAIGLPPAQVFKTLVALSSTPSDKPALVVIPGAETLDLKKLAKAINAKKMQMAPRAQAEEMTGLLAGGISPLALINRGFAVYLDRRATGFDRIYISAGERGAQVGINPKDLVQLTRARVVELD
jgi:Cys-tRNA(Pro)/Cys-tRNA(Cys) deacylase